MQVIKYYHLAKLTDAATKNGKEIYETDISYSFRLFNNQGNTTELHIMYKLPS